MVTLGKPYLADAMTFARGHGLARVTLAHRLHLVRHQTRVSGILRIEVRLVHDRAVLEIDDAIGIRSDARIVRDHDDSAAPSRRRTRPRPRSG